MASTAMPPGSNSHHHHGALPAIDAAYDPSLQDEDTDEYCWTPLQLAARSGNVEHVKEILAATPSAANDLPRGYYGQTALQAACIQGHGEVVRLLLDAGADIHFCGGNNMQRNALQFACGQGNEKIVEMLLDHGAQVNATNISSSSPSSPRQSNRHSVYMPSPAVTRYNGRTALQAASERGHMALVKRLLELGADVNAPSSPTAGVTALQAAASNGFLDIVQLLLGHGADVNAPGAKNKGKTALQAACLHGDMDIVNALLDAGADVHALGGTKGDDGTALHAAAENGHVDIVRRLVEAGADVNDGGGRGQSPIQSAARKGHEDVVKLLRELGAVGKTWGGHNLFS